MSDGIGNRKSLGYQALFLMSTCPKQLEKEGGGNVEGVYVPEAAGKEAAGNVERVYVTEEDGKRSDG
jgi:hypothetical protein